jgi:AraC family transcriptional regulator, regulatory protein of adaptative response / DNA-3-methyladenine glycosylase II
MTGFEALYRAVESRDARWDGRVFVGVTSTGIYCRPVCPVPMPRRENVRFYRSAAAAEGNGFRACRRCRPEESPDSPDWDVRGDLVGRALRLIGTGVVDEEGVAGLARRLAISSRHLHRELVTELGVGPGELAQTRRAALAKQLLDQTDLSSTDVAFSAGFRSVRAYNDAVRRSFGRSPSEIRANRRSDPAQMGIGLRLGYRPPLAIDALFAFLGARAIPGVEAVSGLEYRRAIRTREGDALLRLRPAPVSVGEPARVPAMELHVVSVGPGELAGLVRAARRLLDLDADPVAIDAVLAADVALRPFVETRPGSRLPGAFDGFATTILAILAQGVSLASARTLAGRVAGRHGAAVDVGDGAIVRHFPEPAVLAGVDLTSVGLTGRRATTIRNVAAAVVEGRLQLDAAADPVATVAALRAIPGVGPWTAGYVALRVLRDPDAFPPDDAAVRAAFRRLGLPADPASISARAEDWRPWRGYGLAHLWSAG